MQDRDTAMDDLDALFAQARAKPAAPSADLMARVMADAVALLAAVSSALYVGAMAFFQALFGL